MAGKKIEIDPELIQRDVDGRIQREHVPALMKVMEETGIGVMDLAKTIGCARNTIYRRINNWKDDPEYRDECLRAEKALELLRAGKTTYERIAAETGFGYERVLDIGHRNGLRRYTKWTE